jgi:hypothetical protein
MQERLIPGQISMPSRKKRDPISVRTLSVDKLTL